MKKMNNKGFSLVELIIVIAIMAVLMGVLAPQFLKYVESSRQQKDDSAVSEVENAAKIATSVEDVYKKVVANGGAEVTVKTGNIDSDVDELEAEIEKTIVESDIEFTSKARTGQTYTITIKFNSNDTVTVNGTW